MPADIVQLKGKEIPELREQLLKEQGGVCPICSKVIIGDACLDHEHTKKVKGTGLVRGVLCRRCNVFIAKSENNCVRYGIQQVNLPTVLRACADYLEKEHTNFMHPSEKPKEPLLKKSSYNALVKYLKAAGHTKKIPVYPKSKKMTVALKKLFDASPLVDPEFYK